MRCSPTTSRVDRDLVMKTIGSGSERSSTDAGDESFRSLVSVTADGLITVDGDGMVLFMNPAAEKLLGADLLGENLGCPLVDGETTELEVVRGGSDCVVEMRTVETTWQGRPAYVVALSDVTERKRAYDQQHEAVRRLQELNQLKDDFVAVVSHDLRSPMSVIGGWAKTLRANWSRLDEAQRDHALDRIERSVDRLEGFVEDVLQVARIESGGFHYDIQPFDLLALIRRTVSDLEAHDRGVRFEVKVPSTLPTALGDEARYWQVLSNLLSNATKFSPTGARVLVEASSTPTMIEVSISDEGPGISSEDQAKLFQKFSRLHHQPADSRVKGTGLGLYITRILVEAQGGSVRVESQPERGSTFTFSLPRALA